MEPDAGLLDLFIVSLAHLVKTLDFALTLIFLKVPVKRAFASAETLNWESVIVLASWENVNFPLDNGSTVPLEYVTKYLSSSNGSNTESTSDSMITAPLELTTIG